MFQLNDKQYRNLEEQVLANKQDIARHWNVDRVLADFGITVLGRVNTPDLLPATENENWGYAYLVGETAPYNVYVWTRANPDAGQDIPYWLNIGSISIVGPQGPAGRSVSGASINSNYQLVLTFSDGAQLTLANSLRGPAGAPGEPGKTPSIKAVSNSNGVLITTYSGTGALLDSVQLYNGKDGASITGPQGPAGQGLNIIGTFTSISQAPHPATANMGDAFILSANGITTLYILTGTPRAPSTYSWQETSFGSGTLVTVGGQVQTTFDADTKLDSTAEPAILYGTDNTGAQTTYIPAFGVATAKSIVQRDNRGAIVTATPINSSQAVNVSYLNEQLSPIETSIDELTDEVDALKQSSSGGTSTAWNSYRSSFQVYGYSPIITMPMPEGSHSILFFIRCYEYDTEGVAASQPYFLTSGTYRTDGAHNSTTLKLSGAIDMLPASIEAGFVGEEGEIYDSQAEEEFPDEESEWYQSGFTQGNFYILLKGENRYYVEDTGTMEVTIYYQTF